MAKTEVFHPIEDGVAVKVLFVRAVTVVACGVALTACSPEDGSIDPNADRQDTNNGQHDATVTDLSGGGTCADGQDVTIDTDGASPTITGNCGVVTITGSKVDGDIEDADKVVVRGDNAILRGRDWDELVIEASNTSINVDALDEVNVIGSDVQITDQEIDDIIIDGGRIDIGDGSITVN